MVLRHSKRVPQLIIFQSFILHLFVKRDQVLLNPTCVTYLEQLLNVVVFSENVALTGHNDKVWRLAIRIILRIQVGNNFFELIIIWVVDQ